jgi:hypothetical protein
MATNDYERARNGEFHPPARIGDAALPSASEQASGHLFVAAEPAANPLMAAASAGNRAESFIGTRLKMNGQSGKFVWKMKDENGREETGVVPVGTEFVAALDLSVHGWLRREAGKTAERHIALMGDGTYRHPARDELGHLDEKAWPRGKYGVDDPWLEVRNLPMWSVAERHWFTLMVPTRMRLEPRRRGVVNRGLQEHNLLLRTAARMPEAGFDAATGTFQRYPVIRLAVGSYKGEAGDVFFPMFRLTGKWAAKTDAPPHPATGDHDDGDDGDRGFIAPHQRQARRDHQAPLDDAQNWDRDGPGIEAIPDYVR